MHFTNFNVLRWNIIIVIPLQILCCVLYEINSNSILQEDLNNNVNVSSESGIWQGIKNFNGRIKVRNSSGVL